MTNKEAADKFDVSKNIISTWIKNKQKIFQVLEESATSTKKLCGCPNEKANKALFEWFVLQRGQNTPIDWSMILNLKHRMGGFISVKKGRNNFIHILNLFSGSL